MPKDSLKYHECVDGGYTRALFDTNGMQVFYYTGQGTERFATPVFKSRNA